MTYAVLQDVVLSVPPYPCAVGGPPDVPLEKCWMVRPQLFFGSGGAAKDSQGSRGPWRNGMKISQGYP